MSSEHSCTSAVNSTEQQAAAQCALVPPGQAQQAWAPQQGPAAKGLQPGAQALGGPAMAAGISQQMQTGTDAPAHMFPSAPTVPMLPGFAAPPGLHTPMPGWGFPGPWMYPFQMPAMAAGMYPMGMYGMASLMYQQQQQVMQQQALLMQQQAACGAHLPVMGGPMAMAMPGQAQAQAQAAAVPPGMPFPQPQLPAMPGTMLGSNQHLPGLAPAAQAAATPAAVLPMPLQQPGMPQQALPPQLDPSSMPMGVAAAGPMGMPLTTSTPAAPAAPAGPTAATMGSAAATPTAAAAAEKAAAGGIAAVAGGPNKNAPSASSSASTAPTPATAAAVPAAPPPPPPFPMLAPRSSMPAPGPVPLARAPSSSSKQLPPPMAAPLLGDLVGDPPTTSAPDATMWASDDMDDAQLGATSPNGDGDGEGAVASAPAGEAGAPAPAPAPPLHTIILAPSTDPDAKVALPMLIPGWPMPRVAITTAAPATQGSGGAGERQEGSQGGSSRNSSELKQEQGLQPQPQPQLMGPVVFVAARRAAAILRRREQRARLAAAGQLTHGIRVRKPYMHQSRHDHAQRRIRGPGGRFLSAQEKAALLAEEAAGGPAAAAGASGGPSTAVKQEPGHGTPSKGADADGGPAATKKGSSAAGSKKPKASKTFAGLPNAAAGQPSPASPKGPARSKATPARVNSTVSAPAAPGAALRVPSGPSLQAMGLPQEGEAGEGGQAGTALLAPPPPAPSRARAKRGASKSRPDSPPNVPHALDDEQQQLFFRAASDSLLASEAAGAATRPSPGSSAGKARLQRAETGPLRSRPGGAGSGFTKKLARTASCLASSPSPSPSPSEPSSAAKHSGGAGRAKAQPPRRHASSLPAVLPLPLPQCVLADQDAPGGGKGEGGEGERLPDDPALAPLELSHIVDAAAGVVGPGGVDSSLGLQPLGGHALDFVARGPLGAAAGPPAGTQGHDADEEDLLLLMAGDLMHDIWGPGALVPEGLPQDGAGPSGTQPGRGQPAAS